MMGSDYRRSVNSVEAPTTWLRRLVRGLYYPPLPPEERFVDGLKLPVPDDPTVAREILEEAQELAKRPIARGEAAERRATTLQSAVAIAATFTLAAGSLAADTQKVPSQWWRVGFALAVFAAVIAFAVAGIVALQATGRIKRWSEADAEDGFAERARLGLADAQMARANELLIVYGKNDRVARWKIERTSRSADWFRVGLGLLVVLAGVFVAYAFFG